MASDENPKPLTVGVVVLPDTQFLDVAPVDLLSMLRPEYLLACEMPPEIVAAGQPMNIVYIGETLTPSITSAQASIVVTHTFECAPHLDLLLIPGRAPSIPVSQAESDFIRARADEVKFLASVCTGAFALADAGVLDGKAATATAHFLPDLEKKYPKVKWAQKRWVNDGKVWTSGTITNGMDMMAAYIAERFPAIISQTVLGMADVEQRGPDFPPQAD
jgi:transcriptional regulator GlxA family with amidase domain